MPVSAKHVLIFAGIVAGAVGITRLLKKDKSKRRTPELDESNPHAGELPLLLNQDEIDQVLRRPRRFVIDLRQE